MACQAMRLAPLTHSGTVNPKQAASYGALADIGTLCIVCAKNFRLVEEGRALDYGLVAPQVGKADQGVGVERQRPELIGLSLVAVCSNLRTRLGKRSNSHQT